MAKKINVLAELLKCALFETNIDDEVKQSQNAIRILSSEIIKIDKFSLPESDIERSIVIIEKINNLAKKYPRKAGVPTKQPL